MRLAILSDLHLAAPPTNRCTTPPDALLALIARWASQVDEVILAGDVYDLMRPRRPGDWRGHLDQLRAAHPALCARLERCAWVYGNHDAALAQQGIPARLFREADGLRVLITHGHQADMALKRVPGLAASANFAAGWGQRLGVRAVGQGFERALHGVELGLSAARRLGGRAPDTGGARLPAAAARLIRDEGWDVVIMGHSHALDARALDGGLFLNTGAHVYGWQDVVILDTRAATAQLWRDDTLITQATRDPHTGRWAIIAKEHLP